ncbi:hypothetical protein KY290_025461 [Solanum tuberosum]|uniref:Uncharacterized protein n=1 Tax=Solanum tuberosum TaxID=4113 RepID=A0ABQ7UTM5_SOLTU|nr:hypothetical protein KY290_025461 [Solanum tuberosum]
MGVRVYVSLKKDNKELAKYPLCVSVFVNDCELADRNILEDGFGMCGIDGEDVVDTQALVLSVPNNNNYMNCDIITNTKHKVVLEDQVYKDKETLKSVITQYAIEHRFQWRTDRSNEHTCPLKDKVYDHRHATSNLIGGMIQPKLVDHKRKLTPKDIQQDVSLAVGVDVSYAVA